MSATTAPVLDLNRIRGWLLLFAVALIPHIVLGVLNAFGSWQALTLPSGTGSETAEWLRFVASSTVALGNTAGLLLILTRHRYAPAYFTLYLPCLFLLFFIDPDPLMTQAIYERRLGLASPTDLRRAHNRAVVRTALSVSMSLAWLVYWIRSRRVRAVFGSTGLGIVRGDTR
jgi:hypothetical protein